METKYNQLDIVSMLSEIASYETGFRKIAFDNAASAINALVDEDFQNYINGGNFTSLHGVGKSVAECLKDFVETGTMKRLEDHRKNHSELRSPLYDA